MLDHVESAHIRDSVRSLTAQQLRAKIHASPWVQKRLGEIREKASEFGPVDLSLLVSTEWLIDERKRELIAKFARGEITQNERREFVELNSIRVQMMMPRHLQ